LTLLVALALLAGTTVPAHAQAPEELRRELDQTRQQVDELERERARAEEAAAAARDVVEELEGELQAAADVLASAQERERRAEQAAEAARVQAERAVVELAAARTELRDKEGELADLARDTYKYGAPRSSPVAVLGTLSSGESPTEFADAVQFLQRGVGDWSALVEQGEALVVQVEALAARAAEEEQRREATQAEAGAAREDAARAHARASQLASEASLEQRRREEQIARLAADQDAARARAGQVEQDLAAAEERRRAEAERRRQAEAEAQRRSTQRQAAPSGPRPGGPSASGLVTVRGITVAAEIGPALERLLGAAEADGIVLGGSGWRSPEVQAQLRRANGCPDVYDSPASACRVPTARPGSSEHEKGLAIDFTWQGRTICYPLRSSSCSGNAAFDWLQRNAGRFGFKNLPSEAWHWSTTGR
jgi:D-alanyl-D-alanine carboxypeptidase